MPSKKDPDDSAGQLKKQTTKKNVDKKDEKEHKGAKHVRWILIVLLTAILLSASISLITELIYTSMGNNITEIIVACVVVLIILALNILTDMVSVAATSCDIEPFHAMASRKVVGAKKAVELCQKADRVSSIFGDIIGDVCGIISGASGATIAFVILEQLGTVEQIVSILISALVAAVIAGITIAGKAICKKIAVDNSQSIILSLARFLTFFSKKDKQ